jgi:hypothetical protein
MNPFSMSLQHDKDKTQDLHTAVEHSQKVLPLDSAISELEKSIAELEAEVLVKKAQLQRAKEQQQRRLHKSSSSKRSNSAYSRCSEKQPQMVQALMELQDLINVVDALGSSPSNGGCPWTWSQVTVAGRTLIFPSHAVSHSPHASVPLQE